MITSSKTRGRVSSSLVPSAIYVDMNALGVARDVAARDGRKLNYRNIAAALAPSMGVDACDVRAWSGVALVDKGHVSQKQLQFREMLESAGWFVIQVPYHYTYPISLETQFQGRLLDSAVNSGSVIYKDLQSALTRFDVDIAFALGNQAPDGNATIVSDSWLLARVLARSMFDRTLKTGIVWAFWPESLDDRLAECLSENQDELVFEFGEDTVAFKFLDLGKLDGLYSASTTPQYRGRPRMLV